MLPIIADLVIYEFNQNHYLYVSFFVEPDVLGAFLLLVPKIRHEKFLVENKNHSPILFVWIFITEAVNIDRYFYLWAN